MNHKTLLRRPLTDLPAVFAALMLSSGVMTACGDQKDPNDTLNGGDTTSDESSTPTTSSDAPSSSEPVSPSSSGGSTSEPTSSGGSSEPPSSTDTNEPDTTSGDDTGSSSTEEELCPMADGITWTFYHSTGWTENQVVTVEEYEGEQALVVKDTPNPKDNLRTDSYHVKRDGRVLRIYKEQYWVNPNTKQETLDTSATYGTGFLRCDEAWLSKEIGWSESPEYVRQETVAGQSPKAEEDRKHTYTIEARENVKTSGGKTFANCVKVRRGKDWAAVSGEDIEEKLYWFCPGVGKVREENINTGKYEELTDYSVPK